jgi:hypothetical protein
MICPVLVDISTHRRASRSIGPLYQACFEQLLLESPLKLSQDVREAASCEFHCVFRQWQGFRPENDPVCSVWTAVCDTGVKAQCMRMSSLKENFFCESRWYLRQEAVNRVNAIAFGGPCIATSTYIESKSRPSINHSNRTKRTHGWSQTSGLITHSKARARKRHEVRLRTTNMKGGSRFSPNCNVWKLNSGLLGFLLDNSIPEVTLSSDKSRVRYYNQQKYCSFLQSIGLLQISPLGNFVHRWSRFDMETTLWPVICDQSSRSTVWSICAPCILTFDKCYEFQAIWSVL